MPSQIPGEGNYNFIDLFAGAGGLSEGFIQAGFNPIAHVEMNQFAAQTLVTRSAYYYLKQTNQLNTCPPSAGGAGQPDHCCYDGQNRPRRSAVRPVLQVRCIPAPDTGAGRKQGASEGTAGRQISQRHHLYHHVQV